MPDRATVNTAATESVEVPNIIFWTFVKVCILLAYNPQHGKTFQLARS